jgi:hypothetical protein
MPFPYRRITVVAAYLWSTPQRFVKSVIILGVLVVILGIRISAGSLRQAFGSAVISAGVNLSMFAAVLGYDYLQRRFSTFDLGIHHDGFSFKDFLARMEYGGDVFIFTTWSHLCVSSSVDTSGKFEDTRKFLEEYASDTERTPRLTMRVYMVSPIHAFSRDRARQLPRADACIRASIEALDELHNAFHATKNRSVVVIPHWYGSTPPYSFYKVGNYVNIGFFPHGRDSSDGPRLVFEHQNPTSEGLSKVWDGMVRDGDAIIQFDDQAIRAWYRQTTAPD